MGKGQENFGIFSCIWGKIEVEIGKNGKRTGKIKIFHSSLDKRPAISYNCKMYHNGCMCLLDRLFVERGTKIAVDLCKKAIDFEKEIVLFAQSLICASRVRLLFTEEPGLVRLIR